VWIDAVQYASPPTRREEGIPTAWACEKRKKQIGLTQHKSPKDESCDEQESTRRFRSRSGQDEAREYAEKSSIEAQEVDAAQPRRTKPPGVLRALHVSIEPGPGIFRDAWPVVRTPPSSPRLTIAHRGQGRQARDA
jgi:hypothetical protein